MDLYNRVLSYMQAHRQDMVRDLCALSRIPSIQSEPAPGAPFGVEAARCLKAAAALFEENGFECTLYPDSGYALANFGTGEKSIGFFAHSDVVPVNPADWLLTKPFEPIEKDGFLIGRGVSDNKSGVIATLYLFKAVRELELPLKNRLIAFIGSNEESGMRDAAAYAREQVPPTVSLVPDSGFPVSLGERGILRVDVSSGRSMEDVLCLEGGEAYNIVLPQLTARFRKSATLAAFLQERTEEFLSLAEEEDALVLTVQGVAAHAGNPLLGESALLRLARLLSACPALCAGDRDQFAAMERVLSTTDGSTLNIADTDPVLGSLTSANGMVKLLDGKVMFTLDIRHGTTITTQQLLERSGEVLSPLGFTVSVHSDSIAFIIDREDKYARTIMDTFRSLSGLKDAEPFYMAGGTYCKHLPNAFALGAVFGGDPSVLNLPAGHGHAHQADEYVSIDGLAAGAALLTGIALALDQTL